MRNMLVAFALAASLLLQGLLPNLAEAGGKSGGGRSSSSSGRSYSSGSRSSSSSSGKSYSSGSRPSPSKPTAPSATSPRGKSYSSGPATNPAKPPVTSSAPNSSKYSSGPPASPSKPSPPSGVAGSPSRNGSPSSSQKPSGSTFDSGAAAAQRKAESKEAFRGRDTTAKAPSGRPSAGTPSSNGQADSSRRPTGGGSVSGKSYTSDAPSPANSMNRKPAGGAYDTDAATAQRRQESKTVFTRGQQPRSTWTDSSNQAHPIDRRDRHIESLRRDLDHERWVNREMRQRDFYRDYYGRTGPVVFYHDPYSNLFWTWLLLQSLDHRAQWAYHHRDSMDEARYRDLLAHDAQLEARIRQLETQRVGRDPSYMPEGMKERDLMYSDDYVTAVYNPQPQPRPRTGYVLWVLLKIFFVIGMLMLVTWLLLFKRWGGSER